MSHLEGSVQSEEESEELEKENEGDESPNVITIRTLNGL